MRTLIVVSPDKSDLFFANQLLKSLDVVGVVIENQTPERDRSPLLRKASKYLTKPSVFARKCVEAVDRRLVEPRQAYNRPGNGLDFGREGEELCHSSDVEVLRTEGVNAINSPRYRRWIQDRQPDVIAVCGASIMKSELIAIPPNGILNLHGGLSQYYRGLFTTDWAIHNGEPERIGATVHFVSEGVDDGNVVYQGRPVITSDDTPNTLYEKVVRLGVKMMIQAVLDLERGQCDARPLPTRGTLYRGASFTTGAKRRTWQRVGDGVLREYLARKPERDEPVSAELINEYVGADKVASNPAEQPLGQGRA